MVQGGCSHSQILQILGALAPPTLLLCHPPSVSLFQPRCSGNQSLRPKQTHQHFSGSVTPGSEGEVGPRRREGDMKSWWSQTWPVVSFPVGVCVWGCVSRKAPWGLDQRRRGEESVCPAPIGPRGLHRASGPHLPGGNVCLSCWGKSEPRTAAEASTAEPGRKGPAGE